MRIKVLGIDCDGTMTDGGVYVDGDGNETIKFNRRDGHGIKLLRYAGIRVAVFSSENNGCIKERCKKLDIDCFVGFEEKVPAIKRYLDVCSITWEEFAYIGDDINDIETLKEAGFSGCPEDAEPEIIRVVKMKGYVCNRRGGMGCVREFAKEILTHNEFEKNNTGDE